MVVILFTQLRCTLERPSRVAQKMVGSFLTRGVATLLLQAPHALRVAPSITILKALPPTNYQRLTLGPSWSLDQQH